jgi:hypothetical protein
MRKGKLVRQFQGLGRIFDNTRTPTQMSNLSAPPQRPSGSPDSQGPPDLKEPKLFVRDAGKDGPVMSWLGARVAGMKEDNKPKACYETKEGWRGFRHY